MDLKRGESFGAYEIVSAIGAGGMGQVYRARDNRLSRDVALKVLPDDVGADGDRCSRFEREARSLAALNHPGIVGIYAIENIAGRSCIVMEYVEGQVLADVIPRSGFSLDRLLNISSQIATAIAVAHKHGIVHRDLKPSNVMLASHDRIKVLDFGLAKLSAGANDATETLPPVADVITGEGRIVGTVSYMSPEQAEGQTVDDRSDVFSLGVLMYEMATGERPFKGDSSLSILSAILKDSPKPVSEINPQLPRDFVRIVRRCLAKDPDDRYQSAADLRNDLEDLRQSLTSGELFREPVASPAKPTRHRALAAVISTGIVAALLVAWPRLSTTASAPPSMSFSRLTLIDGVAQEPMISPDGKWVAYVSTISGNQDIYLQSTTGQTAINLTKDSPSNDSSPAFSPDGEMIVFRSERDGGGLFVMGRTGESVRRLTKVGYLPQWFPDGTRVVFNSLSVNSADSRGGGISELWTVDIGGGAPHQLFRGDAVQARVSPNGRRIAFWAMQPSPDYSTFANPNRDVWTVAADGSNPVRVTYNEATEWNPVWSPDGRQMYFLSNRSGTMNLWRIGIDETTGVTNGAPQALTTPTSYIRHFTLSADGRLATYANMTRENNIARVPFDLKTLTTKGPAEELTTGARDFLAFDLNPVDGQIVLMTNFGLQEDLLVISEPDRGLRHLSNDRFRDRNPRWSQDGRRVFFYSDRGQNYELYSIDRDGGGLQQLTETGGKRFYPIPSPDGSKVISADINSYEIFVYDATDFSKVLEQSPALPAELRGSTFVLMELSPDGRSIMGTSGPLVWLYSFDTRTFRRIAGGIGGPVTLLGFTGQFLPDGRRVLLNRQGRLYAVDIEDGTDRQILAIPGETIGTAKLSRDGKYLYYIHGDTTGDIWLVRFADAVPTDHD